MSAGTAGVGFSSEVKPKLTCTLKQFLVPVIVDPVDTV